MDTDNYWEHLDRAEKVLAPLFRAKHLKWEAQAVIDLLSNLFLLAEEKNWLPRESPMWNEDRFTQHFNNKIGHQIWNATASLSSGSWSEDRFLKLNFHQWEKPVIPNTLPRPIKMIGSRKIIQDPQSPLAKAKKITRKERLQNRKAWNSLFKDVILLNRKPGVEIYEHHPYSTYVSRFERELFREHIRRSIQSGIDHSNLCEYVLRPLYFSTMYYLRSQAPHRISSREMQKIKINKDKVALKPVKILPLLDLCRHCLRPIKHSLGGRKIRSDAQFCRGNTCKNAYHSRTPNP